MIDVAKHFGLSADPFAAREEDGLDGAAFARALDELVARLRNDARLVVVEGGPGSGRTRLMRLAAERLAAGGRVTHLAGTRRIDLDGRSVSFVDEAERLDAGARERLVARAQGDAGGAVVLALAPGDGARLPVPVQAIRLAPLTPAESARFLDDHLTHAGGAADLLSADARAVIVATAAGAPRRLRRLGGLALVEAALDGAPQVEERHARAAVLADPAAIRPAAEAVPVVEGGARGEVAPSAPVRNGAATIVAGVPLIGRRITPAVVIDPAPAPAAVVVDPAPAIPSSVAASSVGQSRRATVFDTLARPAVALSLAAAAFVVAAALLWRALGGADGPERPTIAAVQQRAPAAAAPVDAGPAGPAIVPPAAGEEAAEVALATDLPFVEPEPEPGPEQVETVAEPVRAEPAPRREVAAPPPVRAAAREATPAREPRRAPVEVAAVTAPPRDVVVPGRPRIFVHYWPWDADAAKDVSYALAARGWHIVELRPVRSRIGQANTRYYHRADEAAARDLAADLADELDQPARARSFRGTRRSPNPGTLEIWLPTGTQG